MDSFAQDMLRIRDEIVSLRGARVSFIGELKNSVNETRRHAAAMINDFSRQRAEKAGSDKAALVFFASGLRTQVNEMINEFGAHRSRMAAGKKAELLDCVSNTKQAVHELKNAVDKLLKGLEGDRMNMSRETRASLNGFISDLRREIREMLSGFDSARQERTKETKTMLADCLSNTRRFVADTKRDLRSMQKDFTAARLEKARADRLGRKDFIVELSQNMAGLRQETGDLLRRLSGDFHQAGRIWRSPAAPAAAPGPPEPAPEKKIEEEPERPEAKLEEKAPEAERIVEEEKPAVPETETGLAAAGKKEEEAEPVLKKKEIVPDDLTLIPEIGPSRARHLNEAGIYTFEQLARSPVETLRKAIKEKGRQPDFDKWIQTAKDLVSKKE